jgi:hypothetical protein
VEPRDKAAMQQEEVESATVAVTEEPELSELQLEVALYIESISAELRQMAKTANLEALSYFIEMARIEASIQVERRALSAPT